MSRTNLEFFKEIDTRPLDDKGKQLLDDLASFDAFGTPTQIEDLHGVGLQPVPVFINEFWTARQRAAHSLHEISYRACFKPQLPRFFIERLTDPGGIVYDPFMGRGTTLLEATLLQRSPAGCDINPLSSMLLAPRLDPPTLEAVQQRLEQIDFDSHTDIPADLLTFYHPDTLRQLGALRAYLLGKAKKVDRIDAWIRMVATNRLSGHSTGFFSVYTLPPNQAVTLERQRKINQRRQQTPQRRDVPALILRKSRSLLSKLNDAERAALGQYGAKALLLTQSCDRTPKIKSRSIDLVVTSPPFLDTVDYAGDNWLRCWFNGINEKEIPLWNLRKVEDWQERMEATFKELRRLLKPGGYIAFEVGEVRNGRIKLEQHVIPAAENAGLVPVLVVVNAQEFTKTSNVWGVNNQTKGTNTNRIVLLRKVGAGHGPP
jgi:hypothetical protein